MQFKHPQPAESGETVFPERADLVSRQAQPLQLHAPEAVVGDMREVVVLDVERAQTLDHGERRSRYGRELVTVELQVQDGGQVAKGVARQLLQAVLAEVEIGERRELLEGLGTHRPDAVPVQVERLQRREISEHAGRK